MKIICKIFGHDFEIHYNEAVMWLECTRCKVQKDIPAQDEQRAYDQIRNSQWKWKVK